MNAATRTLTQPIFASLPVPKLRMMVLFVAVLLMALSVVYIKDLSRRMFINYQTAKQVNIDLNVNHAKLLLEASALSAQARVQRRAEQRLSMEVPTTANVKILKL